MNPTLAHIRGFLLDLDGTLYQDNEAIPGASEFVAELRARGYALRFVTNTTSRCRASLAAKLERLGIAAAEEEIFAPSYAAARYLRELGITRAHLLTQVDALRDFAGISHVETDAPFVVVGDLGDEWTFQKLNQAFRLVMEGAELIALGKTRYWRASDGLRLDAGPFVAALEFAAGREALVLGKPASAFFRLAVDDLGLTPQQIAVVGDGIDTDVGGAQRAGLLGVLVCTGKFRPADLDGAVKPDLVVESLGELL